MDATRWNPKDKRLVDKTDIDGKTVLISGEGSRTWLIVVFTGHIIICEESEKNCNVTIG